MEIVKKKFFDGDTDHGAGWYDVREDYPFEGLIYVRIFMGHRGGIFMFANPNKEEYNKAVLVDQLLTEYWGI